MKQLFFLISLIFLLGSCKNGGLFSKKKDKSSVTGWNYNDKNEGGFKVARAKEQGTGPGLVFVQGGTFTMGQTEEDVMGDWNNIPRRVSVPSFYIDKTEVANVHYREYLHWLYRVFDPMDPQYAKVLEGALPDTLCWRSELSYNEPLVEYYFRHPGFNDYPVVGVSWRQAKDFCLWRTDRVNEKLLIQAGYINKNTLKPGAQQGDNNFTTKSYLFGHYTAPPGKIKTKKNEPRSTIASIESGLLLPDYRLPFEAEWEYAAYGLIYQNPRPSSKEGKRGEELISNRQVYPWSQNVNGLRDTRRGSWQGTFLANFKRHSGDNAGVAGGLNDRAFYTAPVQSFYPNGFGLYNMAGNVSEWVEDTYRPLSLLDFDDMPAPFRGNRYKKLYLADPTSMDPATRYEKDSLGRMKMVDVTDEESRHRRNYQRGNVIDYLDGDSLSQAYYGYGVTTLIHPEKSKVYKGGSWNDLPYWLSPGTRRFLEEDQSLSTLGFRCAMNRMGSPEGNKRKTGQYFKTRRQRR
ncbi:MAG: SUMF1/EgtB/PvdO family nonheme iron enzyme [Chitinophagaceae bacterium]|nr:SUMF1/EgtB/PvdO family nonheme iron enzyme [Chitinophagaceae bacterium]